MSVKSLLERENALDTLATCLDAVRSSGATVLVTGEAGVGKTALVEELANRCRRCRAAARVLWGGCEPLVTPRPLGPLYDMAESAGGALAALLDSGAPPETLFPAVLRELRRGDRPTVAIFEDLHWADEATLDLLRYLGRRVPRAAGVLLVATLRDEALDARHPLRVLLGELARAGCRRLQVRPLSAAAVSTLAQQARKAADGLFAATGGNPFFVSEVLSSDGDALPETVRDAVLARAARLSEEARRALELVALVPGRAECWLLEAVGDPPDHATVECLGYGMLRAADGTLAFRHEIARRVIEESVPVPVRRALHRRILECLEARGPGVRAARLVHHADEAGDADTVLRLAPLAAREAAALGAHLEAASHWRRVLAYADRLMPRDEAECLDCLSYECYLTDRIEESVTARRRARRLWRQLGERELEGTAARWLSRLSWFQARSDEAERFGAESIEILERLPPGRALAMAYSNRAQLHMLAGELEETRRWGRRAVALARSLDDPEILCHALNNLGAAELFAGSAAGREALEESLRLARAGEFQEHVARAYTNLACGEARHRRYKDALRTLDLGIAYCEERDLDPWAWYMRAWMAQVHFETGAWGVASEGAAAVLEVPEVGRVVRIPALVIRGRVRVRRGDPGSVPLLDEALALARDSGEVQRLVPAVAARAEAAWWRGERGQVGSEVRTAWSLALERADPWGRGELTYWLWRAGELDAVPEGIAEPYRLLLNGEPHRAAALWERLGCPYEAAEALALADEEDSLRGALAAFERLGAGPAAAWVRRRLRGHGVRTVPMGARRSNSSAPSPLTPRQHEVLRLLADGLSNAEIGRRLQISPKTVDHHVSAILAALGARNRTEAAARARRADLLDSEAVHGGPYEER